MIQRLQLRRSVVSAIAILGLLAPLAGTAWSEASAGTSLSRKKADAIAIRILGPQADKGDVILFGLPKPLPKGSSVVPADPPKGGARRVRVSVGRLAGAAWLYWLDREPGAAFSHPSEYLLVDDRTGQVVQRARIGWYPAVNARRPAFLSSRSAYSSPRHRVFVRLQQRRSSSVAAHEAVPLAVPTGAFRDDCLLVVGDYTDITWTNDYPALQQWSRTVGLRTYYATPGGLSRSKPKDAQADGGDLRSSVKSLVEGQECKDVMIYLAGHGERSGHGPPFVSTGHTLRPGADGKVEKEYHGITAEAIEATLREFKTTTFKLKIMSCFAGRFLDALTEDGRPRFENLLIVEVSSQRDRYSSQPTGPRPENPKAVTWFLNQNLAGLQTWAASENEIASSTTLGGSLLAHALERAFFLGRDVNTAIKTRGEVPQIATNFLPLAITRTSWQHGQGSSTTCAEVRSESGTAVNVAVSTNASVPPQPALKTVQTGANGLAVASFRIFRAAQYAFGAAARKGIRTSKAEPARLNVPFPQQPPAGSLVCPAP